MAKPEDIELDSARRSESPVRLGILTVNSGWGMIIPQLLGFGFSACLVFKGGRPASENSKLVNLTSQYRAIQLDSKGSVICYMSAFDITIPGYTIGLKTLRFHMTSVLNRIVTVTCDRHGYAGSRFKLISQLERTR